MVGRTTADNRFGPTPFICGTTLGDGCNYSLIQQAIDDCAAAGGGIVLVRAGSYTEDIDIPSSVNVIGIKGTNISSFPAPELLPTQLYGTVTFSGSDGGIQNFFIDSGNLSTFTCASGIYTINNVNSFPLSGSIPYVFDITPPCDVYIENSGLVAEAAFLTSDAVGSSAVNLLLEDSTIDGEISPSIIGNDVVAIVTLNYSYWFGWMDGTGHAPTHGGFRSFYSQMSGLSSPLVTAQEASFICIFSHLQTSDTNLWDAPAVTDFVMRNCSLRPYSFTTSLANFNSHLLSQCDIPNSSDVDSEIFRGIQGNSYTGTYSQRFQRTVQTTDATPTPIATIPLTTNEVVSIEANLIGATPAFDGQAGGSVRGIVRRAGGGAVLGDTASDNFDEGTLTGATASITVSGNDALITVVGLALTTINWSVDYTVLHSQTDS